MATSGSFFESIPPENLWKLDKTLDFERDDLQTLLKKISSSMDEWEGRVADELGLTKGEIAEIKSRHPEQLELQVRFALKKWQEKSGLNATWKNLVTALLKAGKESYAEALFTQLKHLDISNTSKKHGESADLCSPGSPEDIPQGTLFPYLNTSDLAEDERIDLEGKLWSESKNIIMKFSNLVLVVEKSLCEQEVTPGSLAECVLGMIAIGQIPMLKEHKDELFEANSVSQIFLILREYISFFNYDILQHIVKRFGTVSDNEELQQYEKDFRIFCKCSVFEVPPNVYGNDCAVTEKRQKMVVKLADTILTRTLNDVLAVKQKIAEILEVSSSSLYLCSIKKGCIQLLFLIPRCVCKAMVFSKQTINELSACGLSVVQEQTQVYQPLISHDSNLHLDIKAEIQPPSSNKSDTLTPPPCVELPLTSSYS